MDYKSILVQVDQSERARARVDYARMLADRFDAHLSGIYTAPSPSVPGYMRSELGDAFLAYRAKTVQTEADQVEALFIQHAQGLRPSRIEFQVVYGDPVSAVAPHCRYSDLIVIGQSESPPQLGNSVSANFPENLVISCGRPVLVVPYAGKFEQPPSNALIAWKNSRESIRAVSDALPLLQRCQRVSLLCVDDDREQALDPATDVALFLARHGVTVELIRERLGSLDVATVLLNRAFELQSDLLVMGCYGHARLRELVLGGASRSILAMMTMPVLMSH